MLILAPNLPKNLRSRASNAALDTYSSYDHTDARTLRKLVDRDAAIRCLVTASFTKKAGQLKSLRVRPTGLDAARRPEEFVSRIPLLGHRNHCGKYIHQDLVDFLLAREAQARFDRGFRELVEVSDEDLSGLHEARRLRFRKFNADIGAHHSMSLFLKVLNLEIGARERESSHHARLAAIAAAQVERAETDDQLEFERREAVDQFGHLSWLPGEEFGYADRNDREILALRQLKHQWDAD